MFCFSRVLSLCGVITSLIWRKFTTCLFRLESSLAPSLISQPFSITSAKPSSTSCSLLVCIAVKQTQKIQQVIEKLQTTVGLRQREFKQRRRWRQRGRQKCKRFRRRLQGCGQIFERTNFLTCANSLHRTMQTLSQILGLFADKKNLHDSAGPVKTKGRSVQFCPRLPKQQLCTYMTRFCTFFTVAPRLTTTWNCLISRFVRTWAQDDGSLISLFFKN